MAFRDDEDALRHRVDALEGELARARREADQLRDERDRALAGPAADVVNGVPMRPGARLWVEWGGKWWAGTLVHTVGPSLYRIHYDGWSTRWDETVGPSRLASRDRPPPGPRANGGGLAVVVVAFCVFVAIAASLATTRDESAPPAPGTPVSSPAELHVGEPIYVLWGGTWYPGSVVSIASDGSIRVHYTGYTDDSDEVVTFQRVRAL